MAALQLPSGLPLHTMGSHQGTLGQEELLADLLGAVGRDQDHAAVVTTSGSDAVELALKLAELHTGRDGILCLEDCFHGRTLGLLRTIGRDEFWRPFPSAVHHRPVTHVGVAPTDTATALERVRAELATGRYGAFLFEPLQGLAGFRFPDRSWLAALAAEARAHGAVVIADEVFTGFGRVGSTLLVDGLGLDVDVVCAGKVLTGGVPGGAVVAPAELFAALMTPQGLVLEGPTFGTSPLACAAMGAVLEVLRDEELVERSAWIGRRLRELLGSHPLVADRRVEIVGAAAASGLRLVDPALTTHIAIQEFERRGVFVINIGIPDGRTIVIAPAFNIPDALLDQAISAILEVLDLLASRL